MKKTISVIGIVLLSLAILISLLLILIQIAGHKNQKKIDCATELAKEYVAKTYPEAHASWIKTSYFMPEERIWVYFNDESKNREFTVEASYHKGEVSIWRDTYFGEKTVAEDMWNKRIN